ncbi:MAG: CD1375 family protein [Lachnospira sp.]
MVELYYKLIKAGRKTITEIPLKYREDVQALLDAEE